MSFFYRFVQSKIGILSLIFLSLGVHNLSAQENKKVRFGIRAGINFSHINFSRGNFSEDNVNANWQTGVAGGIIMIVPLTRNLFIQPEYLFSQRGGDLKDMDTKYTIDYLSLPVFLRWELIHQVSIFAGPQFDLVIDSDKELGNVVSSLEHEIEHRSIGVTTGVEFQLTPAFLLGGKYLHGINNIEVSHSSGILEFKHEMYQVTVVYIINHSGRK